MAYKDIHNLLEKYWEGTSSLEEELTLKQFFAQNDVPEALKAYQPLFQWYDQAASPAMPESFENSLKTRLLETEQGSIQQLMDKYWAGESSLKDEKQLKEFYQQKEVPAQWKAYQPLFQVFQEDKELKLNDTFDQQLKDQLAPTKVRPMRQLYRRAMRAAAVIVLAVAAMWFFIPKQTVAPKTAGVDWSKYECENPEDCLEQVQMALRLVSGKMNKGTNVAVQGMSKLETATKVLR